MTVHPRYYVVADAKVRVAGELMKYGMMHRLRVLCLIVTDTRASIDYSSSVLDLYDSVMKIMKENDITACEQIQIVGELIAEAGRFMVEKERQHPML